MPIGNTVQISYTSSSAVSTETRQHPLSVGATVFDMQMRFVTTVTTTTVTETRGLTEIGDDVAGASITDENNYTVVSYAYTKLGDFCIYTLTTTTTKVTISRSGWFNISS